MDKYRKRQDLLGLRKDGAARVRGPRTVHATTEPINHSHVRDFEVVAEGDDVLGRSGGKAKGYPIAVHSGSHRTQGTSLGAPVTSSLVDDERMTVDVLPPNRHSTGQEKPGRLEPTVEKRTQTGVAPPVVGHRSRTQMGEVGPGCCADGKSMNHEAAMSVGGLAHVARHVNAANIVADGLKHAGPDHPANLRRR